MGQTLHLQEDQRTKKIARDLTVIFIEPTKVLKTT